MANYVVDSKKREIKAAIKSLDEKEISIIQKYVALGYVVTDVNKKDIQKPVNTKFKADAIQKFLDEKGTKEQQNKYWELYNKPYIDKNTGKNAVKKNGELKKCGHVATLSWFKKEFPEY